MLKAKPSLWLLGAAIAATGGVLLSQHRRAESAPSYNRVSAIFPAGDPVRGRRLAEPCLACHGAAEVMQGEPSFHPPLLRNQRVSTIFYALQDYRGSARKSDIMGPIAQALSDQDMRDLAVFVSGRTLRSRIPVRAVPILADSPAHRKNGEVCGMCHGEAGFGEMDGYPALGGQHADYLEHALRAYRSGERTNPVMRTFALGLKPEEIQQMARYFAAQPNLEPIR